MAHAFQPNNQVICIYLEVLRKDNIEGTDKRKLNQKRQTATLCILVLKVIKIIMKKTKFFRFFCVLQLHVLFFCNQNDISFVCIVEEKKT